MSSLRLPVRLLGSVNAASAYPRELLADFTTGDLLLINTTGGQVSIPNAITVKTSGSGNAVTGISANGKTLTLTKGSTFLTAHPTIIKSTDGTDKLSAAFGGTFSVIDSVTRDSNGHVTKINTKTITLPSAPTSVSGAAGSAAEFTAEQEIALTGDVTGSVSSKAGWSIETALAASGATAGSYGPSANATPAYGATFNVPYVTVDAKGRVTSISTKTVKIPAAPSSVSGNAGTATKFASAQKVILTGEVTGEASSQAGWSIATTLEALFDTAPGAIGPTAAATLAFGGSVNIPQVTVDTKGRVTAIVARAIKLPAAPSSVSGNAGTATKFASAQKVTLTGDVTGEASSQAGWSIAATLKSLYTTAPGAIGPTAAATLTYGGTFAVPQVTVDKTGRVTAITSRTLTMPAAPTPSLSVTSSGSGDFVKSISASGSTISYVKGSAASTVTYKVNIGTTWSGSAAPYTQTITVSGMLATDNPIVDVTPDSTYDTAVSQVEAWGNIHRITTAANSITVYANDKTEVAIPIQLKCIRG